MLKDVKKLAGPERREEEEQTESRLLKGLEDPAVTPLTF